MNTTNEVIVIGKDVITQDGENMKRTSEDALQIDEYTPRGCDDCNCRPDLTDCQRTTAEKYFHILVRKGDIPFVPDEEPIDTVISDSRLALKAHTIWKKSGVRITVGSGAAAGLEKQEHHIYRYILDQAEQKRTMSRLLPVFFPGRTEKELTEAQLEFLKRATESLADQFEDHTGEILLQHILGNERYAKLKNEQMRHGTYGLKDWAEHMPILDIDPPLFTRYFLVGNTMRPDIITASICQLKREEIESIPNIGKKRKSKIMEILKGRETVLN